MLSTVISAETQFRFDTAERDREQHLIESIRQRDAGARTTHRTPRRRPRRPRSVAAAPCPA
ncbi:hypothetical protein [Microbacterium sp.]|uniref:hypothetical protein n=1 Tax=Microbacterium sp. TaxID=51671 RepID=UPI0037C9A5C0